MPAPSKCPICKRELPARRGAQEFGPFCSARCRSIDLGCWLEARYSIAARPEEIEDEEPSASQGQDGEA